MLTSAFGASIAHSIATAYGCAGTSSDRTRIGFWQRRTKSRVTVKTKSGSVSNILVTNWSAVGVARAAVHLLCSLCLFVADFFLSLGKTITGKAITDDRSLVETAIDDLKASA